ncbi:hypothetical protein IWW48_006179, partial [Coemansia sp. RSA 1200]
KATVKRDSETLNHIEVTFDDCSSELGILNGDQHYRYVKNVTLHFGRISELTALQGITENVLKAMPKFSRASIGIRGIAAVTTHYATREVFTEHSLHKLLPSVSTGSAIQDTNTESSTFIKEHPYLMLTAGVTSLFYHYSSQGKIPVDVIIRNAPVLVTLVLENFKHLDMQVSFDVAKMLVESGVVEKLRNLRSINLTVGFQHLIVQDGERCTLEFAFGLVSQPTRLLVLWDFVDNYSITETISQYPNVQNLVHFNLGNIRLQFTETAEMLQMLPNIEYFGYACNGLGSTFRSVDHNEKPRLVLKKYYPLSLRLKYCEMHSSKRTPTRSLAFTALLLAILCPQFMFAKVSGKILDAYNSMIENAIVYEPYLEYSDRLECLLR